jgi:hypothetical protein
MRNELRMQGFLGNKYKLCKGHKETCCVCPNQLSQQKCKVHYTDSLKVKKKKTHEKRK